MRTITEIIVHCTATRVNQLVDIAWLDKCHRLRGFNGCGYHYVIDQEGTVMCGRPVTEIGAHCIHHNATSIGVAYVGGLGKDGKPCDTRTIPQKVAMDALIGRLAERFGVKRIVGHNKYANKACPCFDAEAEYKTLLLSHSE